MKFSTSIVPAFFAAAIIAAPVAKPDTVSLPKLFHLALSYVADISQEDTSVDSAFVNVAYFGLKEREAEAKPVDQSATVDADFIGIVYNGLKKREEENSDVDSAFVNVAYFGLKEREAAEAAAKAKRAEDESDVDSAFVNVAYFGLKEREAEAQE